MEENTERFPLINKQKFDPFKSPNMVKCGDCNRALTFKDAMIEEAIIKHGGVWCVPCYDEFLAGPFKKK